jgi:hypothetical protein
MAEDTRKNAAAVGMRQLQVVGSFPGAPLAPWSVRRCSWPRWALNGSDARARRSSVGGTLTIRILRASQEQNIEEQTRPLLLIRAQSLNVIQPGALSALTAAPLRCNPSALTDTWCLPVVIAFLSAA